MGRNRATLVGGLAIVAVVAGASVSLALLDRAEPARTCAAADGCGDDEKLAGDEAWLGDRLAGAGLDFVNGYRPDGGGGHVVREWGFQIWVLRPQGQTPEQEAAQWQQNPLWTTNGITVFGRATSKSPTAYFYWRAGGVDNFVELDWAGSRAETVDDLRGVFGRIASEQQHTPYPGS